MTDTAAPSALMTQMREAAPLVHCITNYVAMNIAANVTLAVGASPAMIHAVEEAGEFSAIAGALTVNIGTLSPAWVTGMETAAQAATGAGKPWVLDPVAHFATGYRQETVARLMALKPTIVRGNASEIIALAGSVSGGKGVDATDDVTAAVAPARALAVASGAVVAVTGAEDYVTDGHRGAFVTGGHDLMPQITALGCGLTAVTGAYAAIAPDKPFDATLAALAHYAVAGETAGAEAKGPGSFAVAFLDALAATQPGHVDHSVRLA